MSADQGFDDTDDAFEVHQVGPSCCGSAATIDHAPEAATAAPPVPQPGPHKQPSAEVSCDVGDDDGALVDRWVATHIVGGGNRGNAVSPSASPSGGGGVRFDILSPSYQQRRPSSSAPSRGPAASTSPAPAANAYMAGSPGPTPTATFAPSPPPPQFTRVFVNSPARQSPSKMQRRRQAQPFFVPVSGTSQHATSPSVAGPGRGGATATSTQFGLAREEPAATVVDAVPIEFQVGTDRTPHGHGSETSPSRRAPERHVNFGAEFLYRDSMYYATRSGTAGTIVRHADPVAPAVHVDDDDVNDTASAVSRYMPPSHHHSDPEYERPRSLASDLRRESPARRTPQSSSSSLRQGQFTSLSPSRRSMASANRSQQELSPQRRFSLVSDGDRGIALKVIRCCVFSDHLTSVDFPRRIRLSRVEARRVYEGMTANAAWCHGSPAGTPTQQLLLHNSFGEILRTGGSTPVDWGRWFNGISRRRVEEAYKRVTAHVDAMGLVLDRNSRGFLVYLPAPRVA